VRSSIVRTLQETTLADLVLAPSLGDDANLVAGPVLPALAGNPQTIATGAR
jgi:hypothetical protein